jgi:hypothetical protein
MKVEFYLLNLAIAFFSFHFLPGCKKWSKEIKAAFMRRNKCLAVLFFSPSAGSG